MLVACAASTPNPLASLTSQGWIPRSSMSKAVVPGISLTFRYSQQDVVFAVIQQNSGAWQALVSLGRQRGQRIHRRTVSSQADHVSLTLRAKGRTCRDRQTVTDRPTSQRQRIRGLQRACAVQTPDRRICSRRSRLPAPASALPAFAPGLRGLSRRSPHKAVGRDWQAPPEALPAYRPTPQERHPHLDRGCDSTCTCVWVA